MSSIPTVQKAAILLAANSSYTIVSDRPVPHPGTGDVLVKIEAIGLNPAEYIMQRVDLTKAFGINYPVIFGLDGAGKVVETGSEVSNISIGDRVLFQGWFTSPDRGTYQEYCLVEATLLAKIPSFLSFAQASTIPVALSTAAFGLSPPISGPDGGATSLKALWDETAEGSCNGRPILIYGGSSSVGQLVIQIARYMGYSPIIATSSLKHAEYLRELGVHYVIDRYGDVSSQVTDLLKNAAAPLMLIYDAVHNAVSQEQVNLLAPGGAILTVEVPPPDGVLTLRDGRRVLRVRGSVHMFKPEGRALFAKLSELLEKKIIKPTRVEIIDGGLTSIATSLERLGHKQVSGMKLIIKPSETVD